MVLSFSTIYGQEEQNDQENALLGNNEIKVNAAYVIAALPEISYERILSDDTSLGNALVFNADQDIDLNFLLIPYGRFYFGEKGNSGFFWKEIWLFIPRIVKE